MIRQWRSDYANRGTHAQRIGNDQPSIPVADRNQIFNLFDQNTYATLRVVVTRTG